MKKKEYSIKITNDNLKETLDSMIVHHNKDAIVKLFNGMLSTSHRGVDYFIRFALGEPFPTLPEVNSIGLVKIDYLTWNAEERTILKESEFNQNDSMEVIVEQFVGLHDYSQLKVGYPYIELGKPIRKTTTIELAQFNLISFEVNERAEL